MLNVILTNTLPSGMTALNTTASAFHLQSAESIAPAAWSDLTNAPAASGGFCRVNVGAAGSSKYFRLLRR